MGWNNGAPLSNASIVAALGFTPANKAGDTFTGIVTFTSTNFPTVTAPANPASGWSAYTDTSNGQFTIKASDGSTVRAYGSGGTGGWLVGDASALVNTYTTMNNGAAAQTATLTNGPTAGNPTKWIPIKDNGTTRYIPCW